MEKYLINPNHKVSKINKDIYGHFSEHLGRCIYEGIFVGKDSKIPNVNGMRIDVVNALKDMGIPVLRWPGGCFADEYHWKDGIGDLSNRKKMVNTHWGGVVEDNSFGTHEYFELCRQLGCLMIYLIYLRKKKRMIRKLHFLKMIMMKHLIYPRLKFWKRGTKNNESIFNYCCRAGSDNYCCFVPVGNCYFSL